MHALIFPRGIKKKEFIKEDGKARKGERTRLFGEESSVALRDNLGGTIQGLGVLRKLKMMWQVPNQCTPTDLNAW